MCCVNELLHAANFTSDGKHSSYIVRGLCATVLEGDYFNSVVFFFFFFGSSSSFCYSNVFLSVLDKPSPA